MSERGDSFLQQCPHCTAIVEGNARNCESCGREIAPPPESSSSGAEIPFTVSGELVPAPRRVGRQRVSYPVPKWSVPVLGGAGVLAVITAAVAFGWLHAQTPDSAPKPQASVPSVAALPRAPVIIEPAPTQQWLGRRQASWANDGSKTITFELQASEDVPVWMARVRPQLVVRCVSRATEVFVSLGSAASVESQTGRHTVRLQIDDDPVIVMQWSDSESSHELFAPDGLAMTRRLADARRMRFGFTPYNSDPVVANFSIEGFDELAPLVAKTCGWSLDDDLPVRQPARSARLK